MSEPTPIEVRHVSRWYGDVVAVRHVSFAIGPGVTALLGPNGAGKSTLLRLISGQSAPSQGTVRILGADPRTDDSVRARLAVVPQQEAVFDTIAAVEFVTVAARLNAMDAPAERARAALDLVGLAEVADRPTRGFSKGMRQRVKIAQALVTEPDVILLDEPMTGLDPIQRHATIDLLAHLGAQGRCLLVSSHVLDEVERFGSRILVMTQGRLAASGDFREIRDLMVDHPLVIRLATTSPRLLAQELLSIDGTASVEITEVAGRRGIEAGAVVVRTTNGPALRTEVTRRMAAGELSISAIEPLDDDLDSVFHYLVKR